VPTLLSAPKLVFNLRPSPSPKFVGRENYLQQLDEFFYVPPANELTRRVFVLFGVGGVGKTQICLQFAEKSADR
jgi:Holliday junction resolvasome RuvABC ATP-dependent DNA helicase subunit